MPAKRSLREYEAKRDFERTPEPSGSSSPPAKRSQRGKRPRFVVHEHHARRLHWDLRLEHDGVLMSWAIPNGIPPDPKQNRKAIHVEDHPLSYIDFEGEIPSGYGAGQVLIWDHGTYEPEKLRHDEVIVVFHGERLRGRYVLFQTRDKDWMIHRMDPPEQAREPFPEHLEPMLASAGALPSPEADWAFEIKWDGVRALTYWQPGRLRIESRNLNDITARYPELRAMGPRLGSHEAVLDGEIVAFDEQGLPSFARLQQRMHVSSSSAIRRLAEEVPVTYLIFDLLYLDGHSTTRLRYEQRRALLARLGLEGPSWQTPAYHVGEGRELLALAAERRLEGVLAKRLDSPYTPARRTHDWVKLKHVNRQELVVGGWLPGKGNREGRLGALLVGYYQPTAAGRPRLRYAGRVGTGFDDAELERLGEELAARSRRSAPFVEADLPRAVLREARFVEPELVAEVEFSQWTSEGILRHSVYKGLRSDKSAEDVRMEPPALGEGEPGIEEALPSVGVPSGAGADGGHRGSTVPYEVVRETKRVTEIEVRGRALKLTNRDKVLYPATGFTKGQLIDYYAAVAPVVLAHLDGHPLTLKRYPDGVEAPYFYEKRCPSHRPDWVRTAAIPSERKGTIDYCLAEDLPTLIWAANLATIELHTSLSRASAMETPTALVFDLDPGPPAGLRECCRVALWIRELFEAFGLRSLVKTSGSKGMQAYVPLNSPVSYERTKAFARAVAELLQKRHPRHVVSRMSKELRPGKVLIDWSQNDQHKTTVCVYSVRARERPTISTPLSWDEVEHALRRRGRAAPMLSAEPEALLERVSERGDLFAEMLSLTQTLPDLGAQRAPGEDGAFEAEPPEGKSSSSTSRSGKGGSRMPPNGVRKGSKRARQYEHVKQSEKRQGASEKRAEEIAARTVNKERARSGESRTRSRASTEDISSGRRGGLRSGRPGPRGRTREQLYQEARKLNIPGRSGMNKEQLRRAVDARK